jgi:hypothetical protein
MSESKHKQEKENERILAKVWVWVEIYSYQAITLKINFFRSKRCFSRYL